MGSIEIEKWQILDFTGFRGSVSSIQGALVVRPEEGEERRVPISDVAVVLFGVDTRFSAGSVHRILKNDTAVIFCDWKGVPYGHAYQWGDHTRVGARQIAQANASIPARKSVWARLIKAKVLGQAEVLEFFGRPNGKRLRELAKDIRSGDPSNIEGQAARIYWESLWDDKEFRRIPGGGDDTFTINAMLDYGYTILRGHAMRAVAASGLISSLGVAHRGRSNPWNLADDFIEPFRPAIDYSVYLLVSECIDEECEIRKRLVNAAGDVFTATRKSIPAEMTLLAQHYGQLIEGDIEKFGVPSWKPPSKLGL